MHGCSADGNDLHCGISDTLCERLDQISMSSGADALHGNADKFAVVD